MNEFNEKIVLITGGASGLGETLVEMFLSHGAKVAFTYLNSTDKAKAITKKHGDSVFALKADVSDYERAKEVIKLVVEHFGTLDVLVNNAASAMHKAFLSLTSEDFVYSLNNSLLPVFNYSQAAAKIMKENDGGAIISIGSINGARGREGSSPYCASKAGIVGLSKTIAKELGAFNIRCNVVEPGYIATEGQKNTSPLIQKLVLDECAIRRLTEPEEVGNLVLFLASDLAKNITGQVYRIDCGQYM